MALDIDEAELQLEEALERFHGESKKLRTGRASASMLDGVMVEVYGQMTPLNHIASIQVVDAQMIQVQPFDPSNLSSISSAIRDDQSLDLNPADDGKVIRLPMPAMTEERRRDVVKQLHSLVEEVNISMRNTRHEVLNTAKSQKNNSEISEDDQNRIEKRMGELMDEYKKKLNESSKLKEEEIMKV